MTPSGESNTPAEPQVSGAREWWLVIAYRFGSDLWVSFEETAEDGMLRIRVQPGDAAKVMSIADLRAALDLLEARHR